MKNHKGHKEPSEIFMTISDLGTIYSLHQIRLYIQSGLSMTRLTSLVLRTYQYFALLLYGIYVNCVEFYAMLHGCLSANYTLRHSVSLYAT